jgi:hypothetical protein
VVELLVFKGIEIFSEFCQDFMQTDNLYKDDLGFDQTNKDDLQSIQTNKGAPLSLLCLFVGSSGLSM